MSALSAPAGCEEEEDPNEIWLTGEEVRRLLCRRRGVDGKPKSIATCTLRRWRQSGQIPYRQIGHGHDRYQYPRSRVLRLYRLEESALDVIELHNVLSIKNAADLLADMKAQGKSPREILQRIDSDKKRREVAEELRHAKWPLDPV